MEKFEKDRLKEKRKAQRLRRSINKRVAETVLAFYDMPFILDCATRNAIDSWQPLDVIENCAEEEIRKTEIAKPGIDRFLYLLRCLKEEANKNQLSTAAWWKGISALDLYVRGWKRKTPA